MMKSVLTILMCLSILGVAVYAQAQDADPPGKTIFLSSKCNTCHSIESMGVTKKLASSKAPDLSNVGSERKADWISKWLKKEEMLNGKKHLAEFKGTDEELKTLSTWLETLKKPAEEKK